jgi:hypothetical protein
LENLIWLPLTSFFRHKTNPFGDYNGDGKVDMLPDTEGGSGHTLWHFIKKTKNIWW